MATPPNYLQDSCEALAIVLHRPSACPFKHVLHTLTERLYLSTPARSLNAS